MKVTQSTIPDIGLIIIATTLISSVGDSHYFNNACELAAWTGLTPLQHDSEETSRMGTMSKCGNKHVRKMLIQGARSIINWVTLKKTS